MPDSSNIAIDDFQYDVAAEVALGIDIKPGSCPNRLSASNRGYLPIAILGTAEFGARDIVVDTVMLSRADGVGGSVVPHEGPPGPHSVFEDTGTPFGGELCDCHVLEGDGIDDLSMKFKTQVVVDALELDLEPPGTVLELVVSGNLFDGTPFVLSDCIVIAGGRRLMARGSMRLGRRLEKKREKKREDKEKKRGQEKKRGEEKGSEQRGQQWGQVH